jgi:hypothetical protein
MPPQPSRGLMLHFGVNTYHDVEWSDGSLDPTPVNAAAFDADAIAAAAGRRIKGDVAALLRPSKCSALVR